MKMEGKLTDTILVFVQIDAYSFRVNFSLVKSINFKRNDYFAFYNLKDLYDN